MLNISISTIMFTCLIALGQLFMFVEGAIYFLCPAYLFLLFLMQFCYQENCKTIEKKDIVIITLFCILSYLVLPLLGYTMSFDAFSYLFLCTFVSYISFASSIRYKSLI